MGDKGIISSFRGEYSFLSNFYNAKVEVEGVTYLNSEAAFQAMKCKYYDDRLAFTSLNPSQAKRRGRKISLRNDWELVKDEYMYKVVKAKFEQNEDLKKLLLKTKGCYLEEGNTWGDNYWGVCYGYGMNKLGKILMRVRDELC